MRLVSKAIKALCSCGKDGERRTGEEGTVWAEKAAADPQLARRGFGSGLPHTKCMFRDSLSTKTLPDPPGALTQAKECLGKRRGAFSLESYPWGGEEGRSVCHLLPPTPFRSFQLFLSWQHSNPLSQEFSHL